MNTKKLLVLTLLLILIGINFYLYRSEFNALIDPNDNIFQYALVDEAKNIWKNIFAGKLSPFYLLDSWNERWAEGFGLSSYYAHLPQAVIGLFGGYKLFVIIRTLMLILMPLMFFWAGAILKLPLFHGFIVSLFGQAIFTDGLYGIDASSFLWRGWGLSAQLMALFFLPVAFAYAVDYFENRRNLGKAVLFNFLVASSHFGMFSLALFGYPLYFLTIFIFSLINPDKNESHSGPSIVRARDYNSSGIVVIFKQRFWSRPAKGEAPQNDKRQVFTRTIIFILLTLFSLSYFIIPFFLQSQYRNFSVWDPIWKFDSWGVRQTVVWFLNGDLFDFGRFPFLTLSVIFGVFMGFGGKNKLMRYLSLLFVFYTTLFLGRTTLGRFIDLVPGFSEYHLHRIIVMVQFTGLILGTWFVYKYLIVILNLSRLAGRVQHDKRLSRVVMILLLIIGLLLINYLEQPLVKYAKDNNAWIERSNKTYLNDLPSYKKIKAKLASLPKARVYVGRPGNWGKQFTVGETPLYMVLSQDGFAVIGFLPESWSPNSDPEQFFDEYKIEFYDLYNVGYSVLPDNVKAPDFAKLIIKEGKYNLYEIKTNGWFGFGESSMAIKSKKTNLLNMTRLWFESRLFETGDYPKIDLTKNPPDGKRWYLQMTDKNNFINLNDGVERNIWQANPFSLDVTNTTRPSNIGTITVSSQEVLASGYKAKIEVKEDCQNCILVLKQSFHPNWEVRVNEEKVNTYPVFPFYLGVEIKKGGNYEIIAEYKPNRLKVVLLMIELSILTILIGKKIREYFLRIP